MNVHQPETISHSILELPLERFACSLAKADDNVRPPQLVAALLRLHLGALGVPPQLIHHLLALRHALDTVGFAGPHPGLSFFILRNLGIGMLLGMQVQVLLKREFLPAFSTLELLLLMDFTMSRQV